MRYLHPHIDPVPTRPPPPLPFNADAASEYENEDILDSHLRCYGTDYLVKWLGYSVFEAMCKPAEYVANAPDILW